MLSHIDKNILLSLLFCILGCTISSAQEKATASFDNGAETTVKVLPLQDSAKHPWMIDLYATGGVNSYSYSNLWMADESLQIGYDHPDLKALAWSLGVDANFYKNQMLQFGAGLGYKNVRLSYDGRSFSTKTGLHNHYLYADVNVMYWFFGAGMTFNRLLGTQTPAEEKFEYVGLYPDCFNKWYSQWYVTYRFHVASFKIEASMVMFMLPAFDPDKVAYYNQKKGFHNSMVGLEVKASYRIFTNRRKQDFLDIVNL